MYLEIFQFSKTKSKLATKFDESIHFRILAH